MKGLRDQREGNPSGINRGGNQQGISRGGNQQDKGSAEKGINEINRGENQ